MSSCGPSCALCVVSFASCRMMCLHSCMSHPNRGLHAAAVLRDHGVFVQQHAEVCFSRGWLTSFIR